jgi:hypothetical protein
VLEQGSVHARVLDRLHDGICKISVCVCVCRHLADIWQMSMQPQEMGMYVFVCRHLADVWQISAMTLTSARYQLRNIFGVDIWQTSARYLPLRFGGVSRTLADLWQTSGGYHDRYQSVFWEILYLWRTSGRRLGGTFTDFI